MCPISLNLLGDKTPIVGACVHKDDLAWSGALDVLEVLVPGRLLSRYPEFGVHTQ